MYVFLALILVEEMKCCSSHCLQCVTVYLDLTVVEMKVYLDLCVVEMNMSNLFLGYGGYDDYNGYNDGYGFGSDRFGRGKDL